MRLAAAACLSDNIRHFYQNDAESIAESDKRYLRDHLMDCITMHYKDKSIGETYASILEKVVAFDFPQRWPDLPLLAHNKLMSCQKVEDLYGSLTAIHILVKSLMLVTNDKRGPVEELIAKLFPMLETLVTNQIQSWTNDTSMILSIVFKCFLGVVTVEIPDYFDPQRNGDSFSLWMNVIDAVLSRKLPDTLTCKPSSWKDTIEREKYDEWKLKKISMQILTA